MQCLKNTDHNNICVDSNKSGNQKYSFVFLIKGMNYDLTELKTKDTQHKVEKMTF